MSELYLKIYTVVRQIPLGKVATYGQIAFLVGNPRLARVVGYALHIAPDDIPCHRVVSREGKTAAVFQQSGVDLQRIRLEKEGVIFTFEGTVDLKTFGWHPE
ncbi:MAG: MGMT family protein [Candidatus Merdivicinus sp.]|jgi:methylated-DNA-protein-cysteine methyltransferase-like protein